jgi:uncharacterized protein (UPF0548 family)
MSDAFTTVWMKFAYGEDLWQNGPKKWMIWGLESEFGVKPEAEDEHVRNYQRFDQMVKLGDGETWIKWLRGIDDIVNKRMCIGTFASRTVASS